jgi:excisionase family DNA binding protein
MGQVTHAPERVRIDAPAQEASEGAILLKVKQAAQILQVGTTTMNKLIQTGEVQSVKIGKSRRVVAASVHDYVAKRMAEAS